MVSKKGVLYCISYGCLLQKAMYQVKVNDAQIISLMTTKYEEI